MFLSYKGYCSDTLLATWIFYLKLNLNIMISLLYRGSPVDLHIISFETFIGMAIVIGVIVLIFRWLEKDDSTKF